MRPIRESLRIFIRRLYFTEHQTFQQIALRLGITIETVRSALVLDGGAPASRTKGPYQEPDTKEKRK